MKRGNVIKLTITVILVVAFVVLSIEPLSDPENGISLGLDLRGGVHLVLQAEPGKDSTTITADDMEKARAIIEQRVDALGVSEPYIQVDNQKKRVIVELAGIDNPDEAVELLKTTAKLTFRDSDGNILLDGSKLKDAKAAVDNSMGRPNYVVHITFTPEGANEFAKITTDLLGQNLAIYLDEQMIQNPVIRSPIVNGQGQIEGYASLEEAANYAVLLRSGALPVSMSIVEKYQVGALLGHLL
jgi:preprotein translocase subunit SecD